MSDTCACCSGIGKLTPATVINRPGLGALRYRVGTHGSFFRTMKARLSEVELTPEDFEENALPVPLSIDLLRPLLALTTRQSSDPAIAMLDAWALVADVLTFYQERIANEGFLRTATERRSVLELARLIGYRLRPGVASSVYLAYTLEKESQPVIIPAGTRAQSLPGPGELPQSFETSADVEARTEWNVFTPRTTRPQTIAAGNAETFENLYLQGVTTKLKPNDPLLLVFGSAAGQQFVRRVRSVEADAAANRTHVILNVSSKKIVKPSLQETLGQIANHYKQLARFGVTQNATSRRTIADLDHLKTIGDVTDLGPIIAQLEARLAEAQQRAYARLVPWLTELTRELKAVSADQSLAAGPQTVAETAAKITQVPDVQEELITALLQTPSTPPASTLALGRSLDTAFGANTAGTSKLLTALRPALSASLYEALANVETVAAPSMSVYALRLTAPLFGYNATATRPPELPGAQTRPVTDDQWHVVEPVYDGNLITINHQRDPYEEPNLVHLDASYESIVQGSWVVVDRDTTSLTPHATPLIAKAGKVKASVGRGVYGLSGKTTDIRLVSPVNEMTPLNWIEHELELPVDSDHIKHLISNDFDAIRKTVVYAQSELLPLADQPIDPIANPVEGNSIELANLLGGLQSGRWLLVSGERVDIPNVTGVNATELAMMAGVKQTPIPPPPGERTRSTLLLANDLSYRYRLDTVTIYGNVVNATHGETHAEVLGSGDAGKLMQEFPLRQSPLTYLSAATPAGAESTLAVRVNDVLWHEVETLDGLGPKDRRFITTTDDDDKTTVIFGDGRSGARLPTGRDNVTSVYRTGIGAPGNVVAGQISLLATRPLGVKSVVNPLPATGGANREDRDTARRNAPMAVMALDRLVSTRDYEDFARTYAGIGKASSALLSDGRRQVVHLTIAGSDDIPIATTSDLFINLRTALLRYGDPMQGLQIALRKVNLLVISAKVKLDPDYLWTAVEPKIRAALLETFGFARRDLGQDALDSEAISVIQAQAGVVYVDLDVFDSVSEDATAAKLAVLAGQAKLHHRIRAAKARPGAERRVSGILPAELAYLSAAVPDTLILTELSK
ncbi:MAG TPA: putative baseplate assembly protein [Thermoanaerobaculia bacterium]|nr:putative baseplate assembly protein [Thermoanaerobaculia bacterium]